MATQGVKRRPPNAIFHLTARFNADTHPDKLNLGVSLYCAVHDVIDRAGAARHRRAWRPTVGVALDVCVALC